MIGGNQMRFTPTTIYRYYRYFLQRIDYVLILFHHYDFLYISGRTFAMDATTSVLTLLPEDQLPHLDRKIDFIF